MKIFFITFWKHTTTTEWKSILQTKWNLSVRKVNSNMFPNLSYLQNAIFLIGCKIYTWHFIYIRKQHFKNILKRDIFTDFLITKITLYLRRFESLLPPSSFAWWQITYFTLHIVKRITSLNWTICNTVLPIV